MFVSSEMVRLYIPVHGGQKNNMNIQIKYDGSYPNLCSGNLIVTLDGKEFIFGNCLLSGGHCSFDKNWEADVDQGEWDIQEWPEDFPDDLKEFTLFKINKTIPHGCCGGCI